MVSLWIVAGLIISATSVSVLGAGFSVLGLAKLFSGEMLLISAMAISLEFSKFVLAAYLHRRWTALRFLFRYYLAGAIVVLSVITSMGIFGFMSDAYQSASMVLEAETIKIDSLKTQKSNMVNEINRLNKSIDEIPANRITKRMQLRKEIEPAIAELTKQSEQFDLKIADSNLQILEVKKKVGPLVYISKTFAMNIDDVVKYLILVFVFVFDPLAICLVIATSEAMLSRTLPQPVSSSASPAAPARTASAASGTPAPPQPEVPFNAPRVADPQQLVQMRFSDDEEDESEEKDDTRQGT